METLIKVGQLLLSLSLLVGLHELGHMLAAKFFGMRVEKFSIGFPPKIFGFKVKETEYSLGAIPLGGFVKISGMIDESLDMEQVRSEPQPWEFRAKPAWQRLIVMMGGIIVNILLGIAIFIGITYALGDAYIPRQEVLKHGIVALEYGQQIGLQTGDKILKVNGQEYERFNDVARGTDFILGENSYFTVDRNGEEVEVQIPNDILKVFTDKEKAGQFIDIRIPFAVEQVQSGSFAEKAGLQSGDRIVAVNGQPVEYFHEFAALLSENAGKQISLTVARGEEAAETVTLTSQVTEDGKLGFIPKRLIDVEQIQYGFGESLGKGTERAFESLMVNLKGFKKIFSMDIGTVSKSVKGPIGMTDIFAPTWDWTSFWIITGMLSMWLAFVNFLPIPALDGGHVMFLTYEMISGSKPSDRFMEIAQKAGMVFVIALMALVLGNDVFQKIFG